MPIDSKHKEYEFNLPDWRLCRDTIDGERAIKAGREIYLPRPPSMRNSRTSTSDTGHTETIVNSEDEGSYEHYMSFAKFPEIIGPQVNGMQGLIHSLALEVELPPKLKYLIENATPTGMTLADLWELVTREIISEGRVNLLGEIVGDEVKLCTYTVENFINWRLLDKSEGSPLVLAVLEEQTEEPNEEDPYETDEVKLWRELFIDPDSGAYSVQKWMQTEDTTQHRSGHTKGDAKPEKVEGVVTPDLFGNTFDSIPLWPINAVDVGFHFGTIPILSISRRALSIYQMMADFRRSLHTKCDPQVVLTGWDVNHTPKTIGGQNIWVTTKPDAKAFYLDISGEGIPLVAAAIESEYDRISAENGRMMDTNRDTTAESGRAIAQRQKFQTVTLSSLVVNAASAFHEVLVQVGTMMGCTPQEIEQIIIKPDLSFTESEMTPDDMVKIAQAKAGGFPILLSEIRERMISKRLTDKTLEEFLEEREDEVPNIPRVETEPDGESDDS